MNSCNMKNSLRTDNKFRDFVSFFVIGWMPVLVACLAIASTSLLWVLAYLGVMLSLGVVEIRFLCRHCPHYRQQPGKTVHCRFMWGPTKWFSPRPGAPSNVGKAILYFWFLLSFSFPIYWLAQQPKFLVIYLLSILAFLLTLARYECNRCMFFDCPLNRVSEEAKAHFLRNNVDEGNL